MPTLQSKYEPKDEHIDLSLPRVDTQVYAGEEDGTTVTFNLHYCDELKKGFVGVLFSDAFENICDKDVGHFAFSLKSIQDGDRTITYPQVYSAHLHEDNRGSGIGYKAYGLLSEKFGGIISDTQQSIDGANFWLNKMVRNYDVRAFDLMTMRALKDGSEDLKLTAENVRNYTKLIWGVGNIDWVEHSKIGFQASEDPTDMSNVVLVASNSA